jgi:hypothetical protein
MFDIEAEGQAIPCAISRTALEDLGTGRCFRPADLLARFAAAREQIEAIALRKFHARSGSMEGRLNIWSSDTEDQPPSGACPIALVAQYGTGT